MRGMIECVNLLPGTLAQAVQLGHMLRRHDLIVSCTEKKNGHVRWDLSDRAIRGPNFTCETTCV